MTDMDRIWLRDYEAAVPADIDPAAYADVAAVFEQSCERFGEQAAFRNMGACLSFRELDVRARDFAAWLQQGLGLAKGDRIALMMPNIMQYPVAVYGALRAGLVIVNVNPLYTARELQHQLVDAEPRAIVIVENFCHTLQQVESHYVVEHVIVTGIGDLLGGLRRPLVNTVLRHVRREVPRWDIPRAIRWRSVLAQGARLTLTRADIASEDPAFLQYTGGTTGLAKGAILTHRNMVANLEQISAWLQCDEGTEIVATPLPLYHIFSLTANLLNFIKHGGTNLLITNPRDISGLVRLLARHGVTAMTGVNTLFNALLQNAAFRALDSGWPRMVVGGGMAVQQAVAERWQAVTGTVIIQGYGLTETAPVACANPVGSTTFSATIGLPVSSTEASIRASDGRVLGFDDPGELCIRGPQVMAGYWHNDDETRQAFFDGGWFRTGDIACMDARGWVRVIDRDKDMINVSGFNVYPNEVEGVVATFNGVRESACVGVPNGQTGEMVKLFVVAQPGVDIDCAALRAHCRDNLTSYKVPKTIEFIDEVPKSNVGKILRRELRERAMPVDTGPVA